MKTEIQNESTLRTEMKGKDLLFVGSGLEKSRLAKVIAKNYKSSMVVNCTPKISSLTISLTKEQKVPELLILEGLKLENLKDYIGYLRNGFVFKRKLGYTTTDKPDVIICSSSPFNSMLEKKEIKELLSIVDFVPNEVKQEE